MTNFDNITESPERLAEFIDSIVICGGCPILSKCWYTARDERCIDSFVSWLLEECDADAR